MSRPLFVLDDRHEPLFTVHLQVFPKLSWQQQRDLTLDLVANKLARHQQCARISLPFLWVSVD